MKIGVVGSGIMGAGIAQALAQGSCNVVLYDVDPKSLNNGRALIQSSLRRMLERQRISAAEMAAMWDRIAVTTEMEALASANVIIEAVSENMALKKKIFTSLDALCPTETILATNTSSLSVSEIASVTSRPHRVIGMHFFNPVAVMKAVEIIRGCKTDSETLDSILEICGRIGKVPIIVAESPGFVVNRLLTPMINEAIGILAEGGALAADIDNAMKYGANHPIGPLELADLIGNDTVLSIMETLYAEFGDPKYRPHPLLKKMVRADRLGKKTGSGFYDYQQG